MDIFEKLFGGFIFIWCGGIGNVTGEDESIKARAIQLIAQVMLEQI